MEQTLIDCLEALDRGEAIGEILSRYPAEAAELRPILETAARLTTLSLQPTVAAQTKSRETFLAQAKAMRGVVPRRPFFSFWLRPLAAVTFLVIFAFSFINISAQALPGDALYGAKLFLEGIQLRLTGDGTDLEERLRQNRIAEIENLLRQNRETNVIFTGVIDEMMDDTWRIEGLLVVVVAAEKGGNPDVGDVVEVSGWVGNGRLVANTITVIMKNETPPPPKETPVPTITVEPKLTSPPAATMPMTTPTPTITSSPSPIAPTLTATAIPNLVTATPEPNPDPVPPHEENDNSGPGGGDDYSGSGSGEDNSGSGSSNSGSGSGNSGSGSSNSGSGSGNSGSGSGNSGSGSNNSGSGSGNSGSGSDDDD